MHPERISELLRPFLEPEGNRDQSTEKVTLLPNQLESISTYIDLLLRWNARVNLTSVRQPEEIVTRHFGESLFAARHLFTASEPTPTAESRVIDVGSGAGFPGVPIKILVPQVHLTLIESNQKKATFLRELARALRLTNIDVFAGRASDFPDNPGSHGNTVTLRAVERFDAILPLAATLVGPGGRLAILIGKDQIQRAQDLAPTLNWRAPIKLPLSSARYLIIGSK